MTNPWAAWLRTNDRQSYVLADKIGWDAFVNSGPRDSLPSLSRDEMGALSSEALEDYNAARAVWHANPAAVRTSQVAAAYSVIEQVMAGNHRDGDRLRGAVVIDSEPALGKTTIATRYGRDFHRRIYRRYGPTTDSGSQRLPVVYVPLRSATTLKDLNKQILKFYRHPAGSRDTKADLVALVVDAVTTGETRLIIIDDLHFVDYSHRDGKAVANHLKGLANALPVTFMYTGVGLLERRFFTEGTLGNPKSVEVAQMARRTTRCAVAPFTLSTDAGFRAWVDLLAALQSQLLLADAPPDVLTRHARELFRRTQGRIGSLTGLLEHACHVAVATGIEDITADVLSMSVADNASETSAAAAG